MELTTNSQFVRDTLERTELTGSITTCSASRIVWRSTGEYSVATDSLAVDAVWPFPLDAYGAAGRLTLNLCSIGSVNQKSVAASCQEVDELRLLESPHVECVKPIA